jgi:hypothetical protein
MSCLNGTVGNTKSQAKGRGFSQIERQEMSPPQRSTPLRGGKIDRVARYVSSSSTVPIYPLTRCDVYIHAQMPATHGPSCIWC